MHDDRTIRRLATTAVCALALAACTATAAEPSAGSGAAAGRRVVLVYGDSIAWESQRELTARMPAPFEVVHRVFGGTAPCDWIPRLERDLARYRPAVVVTSFLGNSSTACTGHRRGDALATAYHDWLVTIATAAAASGAVVVVNTEPPPVGAAADDGDADRVARATWRAAWDVAATGRQVIATDVGALLADPDAPAGVRRGVMRLACLPDERDICQDGTVTVHNPDGVHLCPIPEPVQAQAPTASPCPVRSPGAERFAAGLVDAVVAAAAGEQGPTVMSPPDGG